MKLGQTDIILVRVETGANPIKRHALKQLVSHTDLKNTLISMKTPQHQSVHDKFYLYRVTFSFIGLTLDEEDEARLKPDWRRVKEKNCLLSSSRT